MDFTHTIEVRGYELDAFGHVNNAVYLSYYEQARWKIMQELGLLAYFKTTGHFLVVVKAQLKYIRELNLLEKIAVKTSFRTEGFFVIFKQEIFNEAGERVNSSVSKCLLVNKERQPLDVPEVILSRSKHG